jgi:hypothetical protein
LRKIRSSSEDDFEHARARGERHACDEFCHVGVDHLRAAAPVAVDHEVRLAQLDRNDRRKATVGERALERTQPVAAEGVQRAEVARERARSAVRAHERVERDLTNADVPAPERLQSPLDLVELEEGIVAPRLRSLHLGSSVRVRLREWPTAST